MRSKMMVLPVLMIMLPVSAIDLSMRQCIDYAIVNNSDIKMAYYDKSITGKKVEEQIGTIMPQISINSSVKDNVINSAGLESVKTGSTYSAAAVAELTQKIYSPSFSSVLKAARISDKQSDLNLEKTKEQTVYNVCIAYYKACILGKQHTVLDRMLQIKSETLKATENKFNSGSAKKIDIDRNRVSYNNILAQVEQTKLSCGQALNRLKYIIGLPSDSVLTLADTALPKPDINAGIDSSEKYWKCRSDYRQAEVNLELQNIYKRSYIAEYFPTVSLSVQYAYQSASDDPSLNDNWNINSGIGLNVSIPVFDGFQKRSRIAQSNYSISKAKENLASIEKTIKVDVSNYELQYRIAFDNLSNQKANLELAEDVYKNTSLSYNLGSESTLSLIQAESSVQEAQDNYFTTLLNYYYARLDLEKSKGSLMKMLETVM